VTVEIGPETFEASAVPCAGAAHQRAWAAITERYPFFIDHAAQAGRAIPVVEIRRTPEA
jgi:hypothetical protein